METTERVQLIVSDVLEIAPGQLNAESQQAEIAEWDSLAHLRIVTALEQEFGVKPTMREIAELTSIPAITRFLEAAVVR
jgi:acyl carrier protein